MTEYYDVLSCGSKFKIVLMRQVPGLLNEIVSTLPYLISNLEDANLICKSENLKLKYYMYDSITKNEPIKDPIDRQS
jgi:hypothetical protein